LQRVAYESSGQRRRQREPYMRGNLWLNDRRNYRGYSAGPMHADRNANANGDRYRHHDGNRHSDEHGYSNPDEHGYSNPDQHSRPPRRLLRHALAVRHRLLRQRRLLRHHLHRPARALQSAWPSGHVRECGGTVASADAVGTHRCVAGARQHRRLGAAASDAESLTPHSSRTSGTRCPSRHRYTSRRRCCRGPHNQDSRGRRRFLPCMPVRLLMNRSWPGWRMSR